MSRKVLVSILVVGALAIASVIGVAAYQTTKAASPVLSGLTGGFASGLAHNGIGRGPGGGVADEDLATALGITTDELTAAYQAASAAALTQAVEQGLITQAQADELSANGTGLPFGGRWSGWLAEQGIDFDALLAQELGITTAELQAARQEAQNARLEQAVTDGKLTQEQADLMQGKQALFADQTFLDAMKSAFEAAVNDAVARGVITQAQADLILENSANGPGMGIPGLGGPGGPGGHRGGGRGGWDGGMPPSAPPADAPATAPSSNG
jgi:hypothetical protein